MKNVKWKFKDVGPDFSSPAGTEQRHQQKMRIMMGLSEEHEIVYEDQSPVQTIDQNNQKKDGSNTTDNTTSDSNSNADKPKAVRKRNKGSKNKS